jgi:hypothetical protein
MAHHHTANPRSEIDERCARHQFEAAIDRCRQCGHGFCGECLVYSFGERQPPYCIPCALSASGVRSNAGRAPAVPKKEMRRRQKEADRAREIATQPVAAATEIDWSLPVNGSEPTEDAAFPQFDDQGARTGPAPPNPPVPPPAKGRGSFFGRKKSKVVPF